MVSFLVSQYSIGGYFTLVMAAGLSLTGLTVLSLSRKINPSLVLVQLRKTRHSFITERLLMGRKESNQTNNLCHADFFMNNIFENFYP